MVENVKTEDLRGLAGMLTLLMDADGFVFVLVRLWVWMFQNKR